MPDFPMPSRRASLLIALALGLVGGTTYPLIDLALACRATISEACVWSKAYLPLTLGLSLVIVGGIVTLLTYLLLVRKRQRGTNTE
jgi:hypothetical protein